MSLLKTKKKSGKDLRKSGKCQGRIREFDRTKKWEPCLRWGREMFQNQGGVSPSSLAKWLTYAEIVLHHLNTDIECYTTLTSCLFLYGRCSRMEPLSRARNYFRDVRTPTRLHARCYLIQQMLQGKLTSHIRYYNVTSHSRLQRRIQDFPEATYNLATFRQKLHENEENWTGGGVQNSTM